MAARRDLAAKPSVATLVRTLRAACKFTQEEVAERGGLQRTVVVKIEGGFNKATTDLVRSGLAKAFGVGRDEMADYLDGSLDIGGVLLARRRRALAAEGREPRTPAVKWIPGWAQALEEAKAKYPEIPPEFLQQVGETTFAMPPPRVDATFVGNIATVLYRVHLTADETARQNQELRRRIEAGEMSRGVEHIPDAVRRWLEKEGLLEGRGSKAPARAVRRTRSGAARPRRGRPGI